MAGFEPAINGFGDRGIHQYAAPIYARALPRGARTVLLVSGGTSFNRLFPVNSRTLKLLYQPHDKGYLQSDTPEHVPPLNLHHEI